MKAPQITADEEALRVNITSLKKLRGFDDYNVNYEARATGGGHVAESWTYRIPPDMIDQALAAGGEIKEHQ